MTKVKRNFKSSLFANLFGKPEHKEHLLLLCNALNGTNYPLDTKVEINTIEGAIIVGIQNDVSCIIDNYMNLIEHQSTINPNMPLRGMLYCSKLYDKFVEENNHFIYVLGWWKFQLLDIMCCIMVMINIQIVRC